MGSELLFNAQVESRNGVARVALSGEVDMSTVPVLKEHLTRVEQNGVTAIMLDLRDLTFIDSTGLHAFLQTRDRGRTNGHRLILVGASAPARRLFELTGTQFLLDQQEAVSLLDQFTGSKGRRRAQIVAADGDAGA